MSQHEDPRVPRAALWGALALIVASLGLVFAGRTADVGVLRTADDPPDQVRRVHFDDRADGAVVAVDSESGRVLRVYPASGGKGFVRGVLRSMARQRKLASVDRTPPVLLARWSDGRLALQDPQTGFSVDLRAFGPTNLAAFADLLPEGS